jgi:hypothetical protein
MLGHGLRRELPCCHYLLHLARHFARPPGHETALRALGAQFLYPQKMLLDWALLPIAAGLGLGGVNGYFKQ